MKSLLLVVCAFLVMSSAAFAGDWFDLVPATNDTIKLLSDSKDTTVLINFSRKDTTFVETLFLSYVFEYYSNNSWMPCRENPKSSNFCNKVKTPTSSVNVPYKPAGITFVPTSFNDTMGFYRVRVTAENGPKNANCVVYFKVTPTNTVSRFYTIKDISLPISLLISYDTSISTPLFGTFKNPNGKWEYVLGKGASLRKLLYLVEGVGQYCFSLDKQNILWLANFQNLIKYGKNISSFNAGNSAYQADGNTNSDSHKFAHLTDGTTFVGNNVGLFRIKAGLVERFPVNDPVRSKLYTTSISEFKDTVWVSSMKWQGSEYVNINVSKYYGDIDQQLPTSMKNVNDKFSRGLSRMKNDKNGNLWAIASFQYSWNKLIKFDGTNWVTFPVLDSSKTTLGRPVDYVFDSHGKMWILTDTKLLLEFDGVSIGRIFYAGADGNFLLIDSLNTIYLSTRGVTLFNPDGIPLPSIAVTAVEEEPVAEALTGVYPQPAREYVTFDLPSESEFNPTTIELLNSAGMNAMSPVTIGAQASGRYTLPTSELPSGLYFAVLHSGKMLMKKPVVVVR